MAAEQGAVRKEVVFPEFFSVPFFGFEYFNLSRPDVSLVGINQSNLRIVIENCDRFGQQIGVDFIITVQGQDVFPGGIGDSPVPADRRLAGIFLADKFYFYLGIIGDKFFRDGLSIVAGAVVNNDNFNIFERLFDNTASRIRQVFCVIIAGNDDRDFGFN